MTSQGPSLAQALIRLHLNAGCGWGEKRVSLRSRWEAQAYAGQPPPLAGGAAVIALWAVHLIKPRSVAAALLTATHEGGVSRFEDFPFSLK